MESTATSVSLTRATTMSICDVFSIGIGPSSSHTLRPMRAARARLTRNKNGIPFDPLPPSVTSGITPAATTRGFSTQEFEAVSHLVADVLDRLERKPDSPDEAGRLSKSHVLDLCRAFPIYPAQKEAVYA